MYLLGKVSIKSYRSVSNLELEFRNGVNVLLGSNGSGKTSISEAVIWCFNGAKGLKDVNESDVVNDLTGANPDVTIHLHHGKNTIELRRTKHGASFTKNGKDLAKTKLGVGEVILSELTSSVSAVRATTWIPQDQLKDILQSNQSHRMKAIEEILGYEALLKAVSTLEKSVTTLKRTVNMDSGISIEALKSQIVDLTENIESLEADKLALDAPDDLELQAQKLKVPELEIRAEKARETYAHMGQKQVLIQHLEKEIESCTSHATNIRSANSVEPPKVDLDPVRARVQDLESRIKLTTNDLAHAKLALKSLLEQKRVVVQPTEDEPADEHIVTLEKAAREMDERYTAQFREAKELHTHVASVKSDGAACSRCGTTLTESHVDYLTNRIEEIEAKLTRDKPVLEKCFANLLAQQTVKKSWIEWKDYSENYMTGFLSKKSELEQKVTSLVSDLEKLVLELKNEDRDLQIALAQCSARIVWEEATRKLPELESRIDQASQTLKETQKDLDTLVSTYHQEYPIFGELNEVLSDIQKLDREQRMHADRLLHLDSQISKSLFTIEQKETLLAGLAADAEAFKKLDLEEKTYRAMLKFRIAQQQAIIPECEFYLRQYYQDFGFFDDVRLTNKFEPEVLIGSTWRSFKNLSGAESDSLALCLRLALGQAKVQSENVLGFVVMDEPTATFESDRVKKFVTMIPKIQHIVPQVICVTHEHRLADAADRVFTLRKVDGKTEVLQG